MHKFHLIIYQVLQLKQYIFIQICIINIYYAYSYTFCEYEETLKLFKIENNLLQ